MVTLGQSYTTPSLTSLELGVSTLEVFKTLKDIIPRDITADFLKIGQIRLDFSKLPAAPGISWKTFTATIYYAQIENWVIITPTVEQGWDFTVEQMRKFQIKIPLYRGVMVKQGNYTLLV